MKKLINILAVALALATPWLLLFHSKSEITAELSCISNYEIVNINSTGKKTRSIGSLLNDFNSNNEIFIRYAGSITTQYNDTLTQHTVHRDAKLKYKITQNYLNTKTIETHRSISDNSPDLLVQSVVHAAFQNGSTAHSFMYKLSDRYWAIGFKDSPRVLCKENL